MKLTFLIGALILVLFSGVSIAQDTDTLILYDLEFKPTGEILTTGDTAFTVVLVLHADDFKDLDYVMVSDELNDKVKSIKTKDPEDNTKITKKEDKYEIDMDKWSVQSKWKVVGEKNGGQKVVMKDRQSQFQNPHRIVARRQLTRNVKIDTGDPIIEPKPVTEPRPVEPDTIGHRINLL